MIIINIPTAPEHLKSVSQTLKNYLEGVTIEKITDTIPILKQCELSLSAIKTLNEDAILDEKQLSICYSFYIKFSTEIANAIMTATLDAINPIIMDECYEEETKFDVKSFLHHTRTFFYLLNSMSLSQDFRELLLENTKAINDLCLIWGITPYSNTDIIPRLTILSEYELYQKAMNSSIYSDIYFQRYPNGKYNLNISQVREELDWRACQIAKNNEERYDRLSKFVNRYPNSQRISNAKSLLEHELTIKEKLNKESEKITSPKKSQLNLVHLFICLVMFVGAFIYALQNEKVYDFVPLFKTIGINFALFFIAFILDYRIFRTKKKFLFCNNSESVQFNNLGGIGRGFYDISNAYRYKDDGSAYNVKYAFFMFFGIPILPLGCFALKERYISFKYKTTTTHYEMFGEQDISLIELLYIYANSWGIAFYFINIFHFCLFYIK